MVTESFAVTDMTAVTGAVLSRSESKGSGFHAIKRPQGRFPLGEIFRRERHFLLENVMSTRSCLLLCVNPRKNSSRGSQEVENC